MGKIEFKVNINFVSITSVYPLTYSPYTHTETRSVSITARSETSLSDFFPKLYKMFYFVF